MVTDFLNLTLIYMIRLARVRYSYLLCILRTCVAAGPFPASSRASARLVRYLMLRSSALFFATSLPEYADWSPVVIYVSLALGVACRNWRYIWVGCRPL